MIVVQLPQAMHDNRADEWPVVLAAVQYQVARAFGNTFTNVELMDEPGPKLRVWRRKRSGATYPVDLFKDTLGRRIVEIVDGVISRQAERFHQLTPSAKADLHARYAKRETLPDFLKD